MLETLDSNENVTDRPIADFFVQPGALVLPEFHRISESFYNLYGYLMPENFGLISQVGQPTTQPLEIIPPVQSIVFDARETANSRYGWELSVGNNGARQIWQITGSTLDLSGRYFKTNNQGASTKDAILAKEALPGLFLDIITALNSPEAKAYIREKVEKKVKLAAALAKYSLDGTLINPADIVPEYNSDQPAPYQSQSNKSAVEDHQKLLKYFNKVGFNPTLPYTAAIHRL